MNMKMVLLYSLISPFWESLSLNSSLGLYLDNAQLSNCPEAYTLINEIRCYALNEQDYQFYAIYNQAIPIYALRGVTKTCFSILTSS